MATTTHPTPSKCRRCTFTKEEQRDKGENKWVGRKNKGKTRDAMVEPREKNPQNPGSWSQITTGTSVPDMPKHTFPACATKYPSTREKMRGDDHGEHK
jgi:hypothetical protein